MNHPLSALGPWTYRTAVLGLALAAARTALPAGAPVEVRFVDRAPVRASVEAFGPEALTLRRDDGESLRVPLADLREAVFAGDAPKPAASDRLRVTLTSGEELVADAWGPAPDGIRLTSPAFGELRIPLEALRWIVPLPARDGLCHDPAARLAVRTGGDAVRLRSGDEVLGTVAEVKAAGLVVEQERGRTREVAWTELEAASLDNPAVPAPPGLAAEVETHAGDLLLAAGTLTGDPATGVALTLRADKGLTLRVPYAAVRAVRWRGGRCVDATTLAFASTYRPLVDPAPGSLPDAFLQRDRGVRVGRRPRGCPLRLDGVLYRHGFAAHARSEIRLPLAAGFRSFEVRFGIDDEAREAGAGHVEPAGDVDARVVGDGKTLWEAKGVTGAGPARMVGPLDVGGVKELVLVVDYGGHDETLDRATWADPVLLR